MVSDKRHNSLFRIMELLLSFILVIFSMSSTKKMSKRSCNFCNTTCTLKNTFQNLVISVCTLLTYSLKMYYIEILVKMKLDTAGFILSSPTSCTILLCQNYEVTLVCKQVKILSQGFSTIFHAGGRRKLKKYARGPN